MKTPRRFLLAAAAALLLACPAYPWAKQGHEAIGLVATANLSAEARSHVAEILGSDNLSSIAVWMDEVRASYFHQGPLADDPDAHRLNGAFPKNQEWHYVDLPLGEKAYAPDDAYSRPDDVVHMVEEAVAVLEGHGNPKLTRLDALRMIVHFVGDLHQPLHVGNGFFSVSADGKVSLVEDPAAAKGLSNDKGGNALFFGPGKYDELHGYWDFELPEKVAGGSKEPAALAGVLARRVAAEGAQWKSQGDYHHWPEAWATESLTAARAAYSGLDFGQMTPDTKGGFRRIEIKLPAGYDASNVPLAEERLAKAGYHLAELLNSIQWAK